MSDAAGAAWSGANSDKSAVDAVGQRFSSGDKRLDKRRRIRHPNSR
jgi:hypothetical protein